MLKFKMLSSFIISVHVVASRAKELKIAIAVKRPRSFSAPWKGR
jgi:hypothetical protein